MRRRLCLLRRYHTHYKRRYARTGSRNRTSTERAVLPETADTPGIRIDTLTDSASYYASEDPGDCVLNVSASYPKVTIAGNPDASDKINDTILQELHTFLAFEKENAGYAEENRKSILEIEGVPPEPYTASLSYEIKRCDEKIVSFVLTQYDFTGGRTAIPGVTA